MLQVYVGPKNFMVWALDNKKHVYVREGIFPELHIGTSWVEVPGVQASTLCLSEKAVWALTPTGEVYRRFGISSTNFVGDYWKRIPGYGTCLAGECIHSLKYFVVSKVQLVFVITDLASDSGFSLL